MQKIRKGDSVVVISGKDKGRQGVVLSIRSNDQVMVDGVNLIKRHTKPNPSKEIPGGIVQKEAPIHVSNVAIFNTQTGQRDRVGFKILADGRKVRVFKSTGAQVDA